MATESTTLPRNLISSGIFLTKGYRIYLLLTKENISWEIENVPKSQTIIPLQRLVAAHPCVCSGYNRTKSLRCYFCRSKQSNAVNPLHEVVPSVPKYMKLYFVVPHGRQKWKLDIQVFQPIENTNLKEWTDSIHCALSELNRPKNLLVFVNPYGGRKKGLKIFESTAAPLFLLAGIETHVVVTQRQNHAKDMIADVDIFKYDGIICVGGDGLLNEILNGVILKTQKESGINVNDLYNTLITPKVPIGIIPAGSSNAAISSIIGKADVLSASLLIVMGDYTGVDICGLYASGNFLRYAMSFLSYGYFGDAVRDSEKLRWMGPKRYNIIGIKELLCRKLYEGELQLQVEIPTNSRSTWEQEHCYADCDTCLKASHSKSNDDENTMKKSKWLSVQGRFIAVSATIMSCICSTSSKGVSPSQHLGNGYCDVIIVKSCSRLNYLRFLSRICLNHKNAFDLRFVEVYRVREFKFTPFVTDDKTPDTGCVGVEDNWQELNTSVWNCDGEVLSDPSITAKMHCQLINVFGRGVEDRREDSLLTQCFSFFKKL